MRGDSSSTSAPQQPKHKALTIVTSEQADLTAVAPQYDAEEAKRRRIELEVRNKEASRQLSVILIKRGISCHIITECGISVLSTLKLGIVDKVLWLYWRSTPEVLGVELSRLEEVREGFLYDASGMRGASEDCCMGLVLDGIDIQIQLADPETCCAVFLCLSTLQRETSAMVKKQGAPLDEMLGTAAYRIALEKERLYRDSLHLREMEASMIAEKFLHRKRLHVLREAMHEWCSLVKGMNDDSMNKDKTRWRLHAEANQELDLQAWYHSTFFDEIYRMNGPFWYRDAILPAYKKSNQVDAVISAADEAALENVMCSPDTTYGDVASQMYIAQDILSPEEFVLFRRLTLEGVSAKKHALDEKPVVRMFRVSFVEGRIFLTWKEGSSNQGVDLSSVADVFHGINSECFRKQGEPALERNYLSIVTDSQTLDLCLDSQAEREVWETLMCTLVEKEQGILRQGRPQLDRSVFATSNDAQSLQ
jgi:hypothetical protein